MVLLVGIVHHLDNQVVSKVVEVLNRQRSNLGEKVLYNVEDESALLFVDLSQHLMVVKSLPKEVLHAKNQSSITSLSDEFTHDLVLVQELLAQRKLVHFLGKVLHRVLQLSLLIIDLVWLQSKR